jgi:hypothetical protein
MVGLDAGDSPVKRSVENRSGAEVHGAGTVREMRWTVAGWCGFNLVEGQRERRGCCDGERLGDSGRCRTVGHGFGTALMSGTILMVDCRRRKLEETAA